MKVVNRALSGVARLIIFTVVLLFGVLLILVACSSMKAHKSFDKIPATITDIQIEEDTTPDDDQDDTVYHVFVTYSVDGVTYNEELGYYANGYEVGQELTILVNPQSPTDIQTSSMFLVYLGFILGSIMVIVGIVADLRTFFRRRR